MIATIVLLHATLAAPAPMAADTKATPLPKYGWANQDSVTFKVRAKAEIQPYAIGGTLTLKLTERTPGKTWRMELSHAVEMVVGSETSKGDTMTGWYEVDQSLYPTGTGEGAFLFGPQLLACLILPATSHERIVLFGRDLWVSTVSEKDNMITITTNIEEQAGAKHSIVRVLDAKTRKLVRAKCETRNAMGLTSYELTPVK